MHMLSEKELELSRKGDSASFQNSYNGISQPMEKCKQMRKQFCQRIGFVRDSKAPRRHTSSALAWKTLRRTLILLCVDQWSITTSCLKNGTRIHCQTQQWTPLTNEKLEDDCEGGDETTRDATTTTQRVGALMAHHPDWMGHHTGGFRQGHPRYTGCPDEADTNMQRA